MTDYLII